MKNFLLGILAAIILIGTVASTVPNQLLTFKPKAPSSVITFYDYQGLGGQDLPQKASDFIIKYSKHGYIVKSVNFGLYETRAILIIMEKY